MWLDSDRCVTYFNRKEALVRICTLMKHKRSSEQNEVSISLAPSEKLALRRHARKLGVGSSDFIRIALSQYFGGSGFSFYNSRRKIPQSRVVE